MKGAVVNKTKSTFSSSPLTDSNMFVFDPEVGGVTSVFTRTENGLVPAPNGSGAIKYLREDGTWVTPPDTDTTYTHPPKTWVDKTSLANAEVISNLTIDNLGHPTGWSTRTLTPANIGALDLRASNLAADLSTAEKDGIKTKLNIIEGTPSRFGVLNEDDSFISNRNVNFNNKSLIFDNVSEFYVKKQVFGSLVDFGVWCEANYSQIYLSTDNGATGETALDRYTNRFDIYSDEDNPSSGIELIASKTVNGGLNIETVNTLNFKNDSYQLTKKIIDNGVATKNDTFNIPLTVNDIAADVNGNIVISSSGLDLRASNLAADLNAAEKDGIKLKLGINNFINYLSELKFGFGTEYSLVNSDKTKLLTFATPDQVVKIPENEFSNEDLIIKCFSEYVIEFVNGVGLISISSSLGNSLKAVGYFEIIIRGGTGSGDGGAELSGSIIKDFEIFQSPNGTLYKVGVDDTGVRTSIAL